MKSVSQRKMTYMVVCVFIVAAKADQGLPLMMCLTLGSGNFTSEMFGGLYGCWHSLSGGVECSEVSLFVHPLLMLMFGAQTVNATV